MKTTHRHITCGLSGVTQLVRLWTWLLGVYVGFIWGTTTWGQNLDGRFEPSEYQADDRLWSTSGAFDTGRSMFRLDADPGTLGVGARDPARRTSIIPRTTPRQGIFPRAQPQPVVTEDDGGIKYPLSPSRYELRRPDYSRDDWPWQQERTRRDGESEFGRPALMPRTPVVPALEERESVPVPEPRAPVTPSLPEKIRRRYQDPRVQRVLRSLSAEQAERWYREVSELIDQRGLNPTSYSQRVQAAFDHLDLAVPLAAWQECLGRTLSPSEQRTIRQWLAEYRRRVHPTQLESAMSVLREVSRQFSQLTAARGHVVAMAFVDGALETLDQYSLFVPPEKTSSGAMNELSSTKVGIGVEIESHPLGVRIVRTMPGGPAAEATLRKGDIITAIDGRSVAGMDLTAVADLISGPPGAPVRLDLKRDNLVGDVTLTRRAFEVRSVSAAQLLPDQVGYIKLEMFGEATTRELDQALWSLHEQGMQSLILDLRGNPGGLLTTAIEVANRFLPRGTIVVTRGRTPADNIQENAHYAQTWKVPLIVLIDRESASASEILAAAIQENGRGWVVGERSYGKGSVQTLFPLRAVSGAVRLTTAKFYSPEGREMAGSGVVPDVAVTNVSDEQDVVLQRARELARDPRLAEMAGMLANPQRHGLRVIRVVQ
ncbi:MAG: hypothetical protein KatS3mg114_0556 [Planctomycetaceae bacterium]|nr:MAG: hypothetical protein KatS3mg114_0556 [Planctomycetaceae bacterium]